MAAVRVGCHFGCHSNCNSRKQGPIGAGRREQWQSRNSLARAALAARRLISLAFWKTACATPCLPATTIALCFQGLAAQGDIPIELPQNVACARPCVQCDVAPTWLLARDALVTMNGQLSACLAGAHRLASPTFGSPSLQPPSFSAGAHRVLRETGRVVGEQSA